MRRSRSTLTPFQRLARPHALMAAGEAVMAISLANSLFFSIRPGEARGKVLLFLALSMAPFAVIAPLIGPVIDRMAGGRRLVVQVAALGRCIVALLMMLYLDRLFLFPLAFAALVLSKTYAVSKSALVPTVVSSDTELVEANSKLGIISGVVGFIAAIPAALLQLVSPQATLFLDALIFLAALLTATGLPREIVAATRPGSREREELRSVAIVLAASAMGLMRASVGFLFFHLAFWLRDQTAGTVWFALGVAFAAIGTLIGNAIGPRLRRATREELMLMGALGFTAFAGLGAALAGGVLAAVLLMGAVNMSGAVGKLAFDSIVQRNAPDANQGRAFAQFETKFQLAWVMAGIVPVLLPIPGSVGFAIVGVLALFAVGTYLVSMRRIQLGRPLPTTLSSRAKQELRKRVEQRRESTPTVGTRRPRRQRPPSAPPPLDPLLSPPDPGTRREAPLPPGHRVDRR
ncbi:MAG: MFS transporter [Acidimicrobiia bacterium]